MTVAHAAVAAESGAGSTARGVGDDLVCSGLIKTWHTRGAAHEVLAGVDMRVSAGEIVWIGGSNGAGKTTLLRVVAGILQPDAGTVAYGGVDPEHDRRRFHGSLGFLSAGDRGLYARLSVRHQLRYWARLAFVPRDQRAELIGRAISEFALEDLASHRVDRLSLGQRQRVRLAMTFLHRPRLVLLDEPASSLDADGGRLLRAGVDEVVSRGGLAVWCSPPNERGALDSTRAYVLSAGKLTEDV